MDDIVHKAPRTNMEVNEMEANQMRSSVYSSSARQEFDPRIIEVTCVGVKTNPSSRLEYRKETV